MDYLILQNNILRKKLGMDDTVVTVDDDTDNFNNHTVGDHTYSSPVSQDLEDAPDPEPVIIKKEEDIEPEHASLRVSLPQKFQCLVVSLIMTWLANPR